MLEKYAMLVFYFAVLFSIGYVASRRVRDLKDFFTGGKRLGFWVAAFSAQATGESAWLLLGLTGMGAMVGFSAYWVVVGEVLGVFVAWFVMADRFKKLSDRYDSITVIDYLVSRFRASTHLLRLTAALLLTVFVLIYISAQIDATGSAFERFLQWDYHIGAIVGFVIVVVYCVAGGFLAVAWTDMFQGAMMVLSLVMLPLVAFFTLSEADTVVGGLEAIDPALINIWGDGGFSALNLMAALGMMLIGLGFMGSPQIFARYIAIKDDEEIARGKWVAMLFTILVSTSAVTIGVLGRYIFTEAGTDPVESLGNGAQNVLPALVEHVYPPLLVGLYVAAVLSAIMSTVSSLLIMAAGCVSNDVYKKVYRPDLQGHEAAQISRYVTIALAVMALLVAVTVSMISPSRTIFWFVIFGWSGIAATFCPMIILSLFWKAYTARGAMASMVVGFLCIPLFKFVVPNIAVVGPYFALLESLPPAFLLSLLAGYVTSLLWPDDRLRESYQRDLVELEKGKSEPSKERCEA